ncbi:hypothetical protein MRX96_038019 [Rhipicephalus microplus]
MGPKYDALRSDLTEMGYTEAFSLESAPLVARLWSDLCSYQEQCVDANTALRRTVQERQEKDDLAERYRQENAKALAEVNRLHACVVQLKEKHNDKLNGESLGTSRAVLLRSHFFQRYYTRNYVKSEIAEYSEEIS